MALHCHLGLEDDWALDRLPRHLRGGDAPETGHDQTGHDRCASALSRARSKSCCLGLRTDKLDKRRASRKHCRHFQGSVQLRVGEETLTTKAMILSGIGEDDELAERLRPLWIQQARVVACSMQSVGLVPPWAAGYGSSTKSPLSPSKTRLGLAVEGVSKQKRPALAKKCQDLPGSFVLPGSVCFDSSTELASRRKLRVAVVVAGYLYCRRRGFDRTEGSRNASLIPGRSAWAL
jgi:hypothetical protein